MSYLTRDEFEKHLQQMRDAQILFIDTEGTLNHPFSETWGLSTSSYGVAEYFAFNHNLGNNLPYEWLREIKEIVESHPCLGFHHMKHDLRSLRSIGIIRPRKARDYCTQLMAHMTDENLMSKELDYLSKYYGGEPKRNKDIINNFAKAFGWSNIPVEMIREYGANDAFITEELFRKIYPEFKEQGFDGELWDIEHDFMWLLADMEDAGICIDQNFCREQLELGLQTMDQLKKELGFNPSSPIELGHFLLDELNLPVVKESKKTGKPSFDKESMKVYDELLQQTNDKRAELILAFRGWQKTTSSNYKPYLTELGPDGRLRTSFKQHGTKTGRLSASWLQQIPRASQKPWNGKLKKAFVAREGYTLWEFDYKQLEFRLNAAYAREQSLIDIFNDEARDIFNEMSKDLGMIRDDTKTFNYTIQYGGGAKRIHEVFGISMLAAKARLAGYHRRYPKMKAISDFIEHKARQQGFVRYWTQRRRHFQFESEYHKAANSVMQGGAFEIVKRRLLAVKEAGLITNDCTLNLQVHDSGVFEIENGKEHIYIPEIRNMMEDVPKEFGVRFPVDVHIWGTDTRYESAA